MAGDRFKVVNPWKHKSNYALLDIQGRIVQSGELRNGAQIVEVPGLTSGVYLFELRSESGRLTKKASDPMILYPRSLKIRLRCS